MQSSRVILFRMIVPFFFIVSFLPLHNLHAEDRKPTGEAFSDPGYIVPMSKEWQQQAVQHDDAIKHADLVVNIDQSEHPLLSPVIKEYAAERNLNIFVISGTCGVSNRNLMNKSIDIGSFCCPPGAEDRLPGLQFHTLGITPLALIVHPGNPIDNITFEEAQKAFAGEIQRWQQLKTAPAKGALAAVIQPVTFIHCKNRPGHWRLLLNDEELFSVGIRNVTDVPAMIYQVANDKNAIGYETLWLAQEYYKSQGNIKVLKLNGIDPSETGFLLQTQYPLYRVYSMTTWTDKASQKTEAEKLIRYLLEYMDANGSKYHILSAKQLRQAGWQFKGDELVGPPGERQ